ncbi:ATP-dependent DNA helicase DinG [Paraferrimonas haliotis]|uniref:ATP-dependent DNA helicase DinG n=1 Tax=Paraferrimonas haliotis TaxID=2013866 RepID=A0AA37TLL0_9GAMM|nr:ATP-dependent DNA helicase DinG [Paraferrimonas haliotis]GLS83872.1 ATP-dependent DNA helicase DinG [Paraferrimonas haliotis]GLS83999.1 ATP-dependent DNA helicase DinG [Paraferrimonas haliotis]
MSQTKQTNHQVPDKVKTQIRSIYQKIAGGMQQFNRRKEQNYMVAEVTKVLAGEYDSQRRMMVVEAGTGIGKSLAYLLGAIPLALAKGKQLCIATATVALQEQLVKKELPFFLAQSELDFKFGLVKGRQRYVCLSKLELFAGEAGDSQQALWQTKPDEAHIKLLKKLLTDYHHGRWDGDRDSLPQTIPDPIWNQISSDKHSCQKNVADHRYCPFHKARDDMDSWDVLVVNHSLLLADLSLGGGVILPDPENMYFVIDEAHHLPQVTRDFSSASATLRASADWLQRLDKSMTKIQALVPSEQAIKPCQSLMDELGTTVNELKLVAELCQANGQWFENSEDRVRFEHGQLPTVLKQHASDLADSSKTNLKHLNRIQTLVNEALKDGDITTAQAEPVLIELGNYIQRLENLQQLWKMMALELSPKAPPLARWIALRADTQPQDYLVSASPIEVGDILEHQLWSKAAGVILCSATLRALNQFDHFRHQIGLTANDGTRYLALQSPFDFENNATLYLPKMRFDPSQDAFTQELIEKLPQLLEDEPASLVLFSSYWQMNQVVDALKHKIKIPLLVQGDLSPSALLSQHKQRCDAHKPSIIFGTASLSEGLDLPGDYLTNLIITKLPFAVPTSPVEEAHAEFVKARGGNPFMQLTVPDASRKLIQSCGRLLRKEQDYGRITILDKRLVTRRYGSALLDGLPGYRRVIES